MSEAQCETRLVQSLVDWVASRIKTELAFIPNKDNESLKCRQFVHCWSRNECEFVNLRPVWSPNIAGRCFRILVREFKIAVMALERQFQAFLQPLHPWRNLFLFSKSRTCKMQTMKNSYMRFRTTSPFGGWTGILHLFGPWLFLRSSEIAKKIKKNKNLHFPCFDNCLPKWPLASHQWKKMQAIELSGGFRGIWSRTPFLFLPTTFRRGSRILVRGAAEFWPQGEALSLKFAHNRGFALKIPWKLKKSWGWGGPGPKGRPLDPLVTLVLIWGNGIFFFWERERERPR